MTRIRATYELDTSTMPNATPAELEALARALAVEQSVEMPLEAIDDHRILTEMVGTVEDLQPIGTHRHRAVVGLATATVDANPVQLLNMLFGNCSLQDHVRLVDVELPPALLDTFPGPRFGVAGLRRLVGATDRPLTCTALKPQGLSPAELATLCGRFADAGIDIVKDDHGIADQGYAPFAERVAACQRAVEAANRATGRQVRYAPSIVGTPDTVTRYARIARDEGVEIVLVAPMLVGMGTFVELLATGGPDGGPLDLAVLGHPAFAGNGIEPALFLGRLFRLYGADAVIFPNFGGRFAYSPERCAALARAALAPWGDIAPALPTAAGGITVDRVDELVDFYGNDVMLLIGGNLLAAGDQLPQRARSFVERVARR